MKNQLTKKQINAISHQVIGAAITVHKELGSGLLESVYHECMKEELRFRRLLFLSEVRVPVLYRNKELSTDLRCDLFIEDCIVVELKSVKAMNEIFQAQLLTYMRLLKAPKGILINFNSTNIFYKGQKTYVNDYYEALAA